MTGSLSNYGLSGVQGKVQCLVKNIYSNVENRVLFGDIESPWFEQEFSVKQGYVLLPTLFSVLMNDLLDMLNEWCWF